MVYSLSLPLDLSNRLAGLLEGELVWLAYALPCGQAVLEGLQGQELPLEQVEAEIRPAAEVEGLAAQDVRLGLQNPAARDLLVEKLNGTVLAAHLLLAPVVGVRIALAVKLVDSALGHQGESQEVAHAAEESVVDARPVPERDVELAQSALGPVVIAEELGFIGAAGVLGLFYYLLYRGLSAGTSAQDRLGTYICLLVVAWIATQMAINVGMVLGLLPTIGVPLPLLSYGGSALVAATCGIALIVNVRSRRFVN